MDRLHTTGVLLIVLVLLASFAAGPQLTAPVAAAAPAPRFGTFLGGRSGDTIKAIAVDPSGIYVVGETYSADLAGFSGTLRGSTDLFVARLTPAGDALVWGVYLGGAAGESAGGIALDGRGGVWVVGSSTSDNFPTTANAFQGANNGGYDAIIAQLDAATGAVRYGSYFGAEYVDEARGIAADDQGHMLITGQGGADVLAVRIDAATYAVAYAGYFGGSGEDSGYAVAAGPNGYAFITGATDGPGSTMDFPLVNPLQAECGQGSAYGGCGQDAFVTAIAPDGQIVYSTLLGGGFAGSELSSGSDTGKAIAVDAAGYIYVAGETYAGDFPTHNAFQSVKRGSDTFGDGFIAKIAPDGGSLVYASYLGGAESDEVRAIEVDAQGNAYVVGFSNSRDFPLRNAFQGQLGNGVCGIGDVERYCEDAVLAAFGPAGELHWSSYLGGGLDDYGYGLALDANGGLYLAGTAYSAAGQGFPTSVGSLQPAKQLRNDGFIIALGGAPPPPEPIEQPYQVYVPLLRR
jgi:hypothetical protein